MSAETFDKIDYLELYNIFILQCRTKVVACYTEKHHIVPKCLGGNNCNTNLIKLSAQDHYEAHRLLALAYPKCAPLWNAWWIMTHTRDGIQIDQSEYQLLRETNAILHSKRMKGVLHGPMSDETKAKLSKINTGKTMSTETKRKISLAHKGRQGVTPSDETKEKISKSLTGRKQCADVVQKRAESIKGRKNTPETINKMKKSAKTRKRKWNYVTPKGTFVDYKEAAIVNDIKPVTLIYRCKKEIKGFLLVPEKSKI